MKNQNINFFVVQLVLACFALSPQAQAICQEGCLTNSNTVLGDDALLNNIGIDNTAIGYQALFSHSGPNGNYNTAIGVQALYNNTGGLSKAAKTRPPVGLRSFTIHSGRATRPTVLVRSLATLRAAATRPPVPLRFMATQPASATQPPVIMRFLATQPAITTSQLACKRS